MKTISRLKMVLVLVLLGWASMANAEDWSGTISTARTYSSNTVVNVVGNVTINAPITVTAGTLTINASGANRTIYRGANMLDISSVLITLKGTGCLVINGGTYKITFDGQNLESTWGADPIVAEAAACSITMTDVTVKNFYSRYNGTYTYHTTFLKTEGSLTLTGCTFQNNSIVSDIGDVDMSSVILAHGSSVTMTNCTFSNNGNNGDGQGGALIHYGGTTLQCTRCQFIGNYAFEGGAIFASNLNSMTLNGCTFTSNELTAVTSYVFGGAIEAEYVQTITINNKTSFNGNHSDDGGLGGALGLYHCDNVTIDNATFDGNYALQLSRGGGAIFFRGSDDQIMNVNNCTFKNNYTSGVDYYHTLPSPWNTQYGSYGGAGGGIYIESGVVTITNTSFTGNHAETAEAIPGTSYPTYPEIYASAGGAIFIYKGTLNMENCRVNGNVGAYQGSGIAGGTYAICTINMKNCEVANNTNATQGGGIYIGKWCTLNITGDSESMNHDVHHNSATEKGGGIYKLGKLYVGDLVHVENNTAKYGTSTARTNNVYIPAAASQKYVNIREEGLLCGSNIGVTKTRDEHTYEADDVFGGVRTDIARGTQANCDYAFRNRFFFDDTDTYHVHNLTQGSTNPYANADMYFIDTWNSYIPEAVVNTDYKVADGFVTEVMTAKGLAYFAWDVNNNHDYAGKTVKQTADIDLAAHYWEPIGIKAYGDCIDTYMPFKGTYDGQGYVIRNVHSILPYDALGLFGYVDGGTVTRTFVESGSMEATGSRTVGIGGLVGRLLNGATVTYSEARVDIKQTATATMGGLAGLVDGNSNIHSSMTMSSLSNNGVTGGLIGQMTAGSTLKNSFSNDVYTLTGTPYAGGIVGVNAGTVANCYANDTRNANSIASTVKFGWLAGQNRGTFQYCYAPNNAYGYINDNTDGTDTYTNTEPGHFTVAESLNGKYKYNQYDQKVTDGGTTHKPTVGKVNLLGYLNHWVSGDYASWTRTLSSPINTDYPVMELSTFACAGSTDGVFIWYSPTLDAMTTRYNALDGGGSIYLYTAQEDVSVSNDSDVNIYIGEEIGITQTDANTLQSAHVGVTFDNSDGSSLGGANYDWHMFATPLSNASMGLTYSNAYLTIDNSTWGDNGVWPHDPPAGSLTLGANCYFPADTPYGAPHTSTGSFDFYCFSEPYYHWVNFKRHSDDHWHHDGDCNHNHASLDYGDYNASGTWVDGNETTMIPAKGYMMAVDKETTLINSGTLNNGTVTRKVTHSTLESPMSSLEGCNLIGNPYQSYLDFDEFASTNGINTYYILDADEHDYAAYTVGQTEVYSGDDVTEPRYVHPHQGFFVQVAADKTVTFDKTMRKPKGKANSYFRDEEVPAYPLVRLTVGDSDGNNDYVTIELDRPEQGGGAKAKGLHTGNGIIYAHLDDGNDYHVAFTESGMESIPVRFEAFDNDVFTLRWKTMNADFSYLHLIDNLTGTDIDCLVSDKYCFEGKPSDYASRFKLVFEFTDVDENEEDGASTGSETFAFMMGDEMVVNGEGTLQLFDMTGRMLMQQTLCGTQTTTVLPSLTAGVYVVRLIDKGCIRTQKMVINQ